MGWVFLSEERVMPEAHLFLRSHLDLVTEDLVVALSKAGVTTHAGTRGANAGGIASRDLTASIAKAYLKRKKKLPKAFKRGATRARDDR